MYTMMAAILLLQIYIFINYLQIRQEIVGLEKTMSKVRLQSQMRRNKLDIRVYCDEKGGAIGWDYRRCYVSFKPIGLTIPQMVEKCRLRSLILFYPKSMAEIQFIGSDMGKKVVFFGKEIPTQFKESGQGDYVTYDNGGLSYKSEQWDLEVSNRIKSGDALCIEEGESKPELYRCRSTTGRSKYICISEF
ncbi:uncharacterized protein LOC134845939 isoform X2 [Symsagittifera roscoffensis]|uniref:uncharacterized protein LOC134845939 isoform X2 n=1 Tax=Symsagittifera roscoffensis TaxID=84072 RepID=UPI00307B3078